MLTRRRFLGYSALATAALRPSLVGRIVWCNRINRLPISPRVPGRSTDARMYSTPTCMR